MRPKKKDEFIVSDELRARVIEFWKTNYNNTTKDIMEHFNIPYSPATTIINKYLKEITKKFNNDKNR